MHTRIGSPIYGHKLSFVDRLQAKASSQIAKSVTSPRLDLEMGVRQPGLENGGARTCPIASNKRDADSLQF